MRFSFAFFFSLLITTASFGQSKVFKEVSEEIKNGVDHIVQYKQQDETSAQPSSLIKWNNGNVTILRP